MKKFILVLLGCLVFVPLAMATDWSRYDSKVRNLMVEGYQTQPGYVAFKSQAGTVAGYLYAHSNGSLYWQCTTAGSPTACLTGIDLTTTKLGSVGGEVKVGNLVP